MTLDKRFWINASGICLVFAFGTITGGLLTAKLIERRAQGFFAGTHNDLAGDIIVRRLGRRLSLDANQREQVRAVVRDARTDLRQVRQQIHPQLRDIFGRSQTRIHALLRPSQQREFEKLTAAFRANWSLGENAVSPASSPATESVDLQKP